MKSFLSRELDLIKQAGLLKIENEIASAQGAEILLKDGQKLINFCSNNYLGLSSDPRLIQAAKNMLEQRGYGMSSVRFICGTQDIHKQLEATISRFFQTEDCILYAAAFDANGGIFECLFDKDDAIISDELNHASIIDGVRLSKAQKFRYKHSDMDELENALKIAQAQRFRIIVTDGVFSMDGDMAKLPEICRLAKQYDVLVMVDDSHAAGFIGKSGRGTPEFFDVHNEVDIITGTLGKALGGAMGGYTTGKREIIDFLRQKSRPYLFSNSLAPVIVGAALEAFDILDKTNDLRSKLFDNLNDFKSKLSVLGFDLKKSDSAIIALMLYDASLAKSFQKLSIESGIYVVGFSFPVVPKDQARIRIQISASHSKEQLDKAIRVFEKVGKELGVI